MVSRKVNVNFFEKQYEAYEFKTQFCLVCAGVQCISEDEFVYTPKGIIQVKDVKNGDEILGGKVSNVYQFKDDIYEVHFNNGIKIKTNLEHPFYCKNKGWIRLKDIKAKKDKVFFYSVDKKNVIERPIKSAKLLGYLCSDGYVSGEGQSLKFTNTNFHFIDEVRRLSKAFPDIKPHLYKKGKGWDLLLTTYHGSRKNSLKDYIKELKITKDSFGKIVEGDKNSLIDFLQGFFNGDGYLTLYQNRRNRKDIYLIGFCIGTSKRKAYEMQYILWKLGIRSHIREESYKKSQKYFYRVVVDRNSSEKLLHLLDWSKYPLKFYKASLIKTIKARNNKEWLSVSSIKKIGKGIVKGWKTTTHEIISYCGMKTHNSGKTYLGSVWVVKKFKTLDQCTGAIIAPTYKILQQSTLQKFFSLFPILRLGYKEQKGEIEISPVKKIFVRSADNPLSLEGMSLDFAWLDEAGMMPRLVWDVIRSRVSMTGGQVLLTTTPYGINWLYYDFYLPWLNKQDPSLSFFTWKSIDNPKFNKKFFESERKRMSEKEFRRRYCGEFQKMEGLVYDLPESQIIDPKEINDATYVCGVDWGYKNPSAILVLAITQNEIYAVDEWKESGKTTPEIINILKALISRYNIKHVFPDPAEPDRIKELDLSGIKSEKVSKDLKGGISFIQHLIKERKLFIFKNCVNLIDEMNSYHYPEKLDAYPDIPVKLNDHLLDCLRYALYSYNLNLKSSINEKVTDEIICGNF